MMIMIIIIVIPINKQYHSTDLLSCPMEPVERLDKSFLLNY
jgi:hypothetical protein